MVLVDADAVEAELVGQHQLVEVAVVKLVAVRWVVERVRQPGPSSFVFVPEIGRQPIPGHQVEGKAVHG